jgi:hypothetical protein
MININELKTNLAYVFKTITQIPVIWANQNANTPSGDFILLKISAIRSIGATDYESPPMIDNQQQNTYKIFTNGDREIVLSIQCISENSFEILLDFLNKIRLNKNNIDILNEKKLVFVGVEGDIADITTNINGAFESRASLELIFRVSKNYSSDDTYEVGVVEKIEMDATLQGNASETPIEFDISIEQ